MRILILTPGIFPDDYGGLPKLVYNMGKMLSHLGHTVVVLTRKFNKCHPDFEIIDGMEYHRTFIPKRGDLLHSFWPAITAVRALALAKKIRKSNAEFDVVWTHNAWWTLFFDPRKFWPGAKLIYNFHSDGLSEILYNYGRIWKARLMGQVYRWVEINLLRRSDIVVVHSEFMGRRCREMTKKEIEVAIIPAGADPELFRIADAEEKRELRVKYGLPVNGLVIITARGLKPRTGVDKLVVAASYLKKNGFSFFLEIIGEGIMKDRISSMIQELGLEGDVRITGGLSEEDLALRYRASDVFVLPTQGIEGFGLATAEALASGLVVFGTNNSATPEILSKYRREWLIDGCDADSIYKKLAEYCQDAGRFNLPKETIRDITLRNFTWSLAANRLVEAMKSS